MLIKLDHIVPENEKTHKLFQKEIDSVLIHRIGVGTSASDVVHAFLGGLPEAARATGYKMPYHFLVEPDGRVVQTIALNYQGVHALQWNKHSYGIAALGDFRYKLPTVEQWRATVLLAALLSRPKDLGILGHDECADGSHDPRKQCPGVKWKMEQFRECILDAAVTEHDLADFWRYVRQ